MKRHNLFYISCVSIIVGFLSIGLGVGLWVALIKECIFVGLGLGLIVVSLYSMKIYRNLSANNKDKI